MTYDVARRQIIAFGDFGGLSLDGIADKNGGILYLDKLSRFGSGTLLPETEQAIAVFLAHPDQQNRLRLARIRSFTNRN